MTKYEILRLFQNLLEKEFGLAVQRTDCDFELISPTGLCLGKTRLIFLENWENDPIHIVPFGTLTGCFAMTSVLDTKLKDIEIELFQRITK